jgi:hypothetical protein
MARARNIKPKFFTNDNLGELDPLARLLFIGLWTIADFKGCLEYRPKRIKAQLLPYDECNIDELSNILDKSGFIAIYSVRGQLYIKILKFEAHQNPHKNERDAGSDIPDIAEKDSEINELSKDGINRDKNGTARADSLFPLPDSCFLNPSSLFPESPNPSVTEGASPPSLPKKNDSTKNETATASTWESYSEAYFLKYKSLPVRNASVNAKLSQFVKRLGSDEAPHVASFFVSHNNGYYVREMHSVGAMLKDAEKLRTEWATNSRMTQTKASQADKTATNLDAFAPLIAAAREREEAERKRNAE